MATVLDRTLSTAEYLERDHAENRRFEYIDGEVREVTGASRSHNLICWNILLSLGRTLDRRRFEAYPGNMRVAVEETGPYYYPDVAVAATNPAIRRDRGETLLNPVLLFEVLSTTTEGIDRGEKLANYGRIASVIDYVLIAQDELRIDHFSRQADGSWRLVILEGERASLSLPAVGVELPLAEIYDRILPGA